MEHEEVGGVTGAVGIFSCSDKGVNLKVEDLKVRQELRHVLGYKQDGNVPAVGDLQNQQ